MLGIRLARFKPKVPTREHFFTKIGPEPIDCDDRHAIPFPLVKERNVARRW